MNPNYWKLLRDAGLIYGRDIQQVIVMVGDRKESRLLFNGVAYRTAWEIWQSLNLPRTPETADWIIC